MEDFAISARNVESALLSRCLAVARENGQSARDQREANVLHLASMVLRTTFPTESAQLQQISERYFEAHPTELLEGPEIIHKGWVVSLPRLRDMLVQKLREEKELRL